MNSISYLYFITPLIAFLLSMVLIPVFRKLAFRISLVDLPNHRKKHNESVPLIGGISVFLSVNLAMLFSLAFDVSLKTLEPVFIMALVMLVMGVIDDRKDLRASIKLAVQLLLAHWIFSSGIRIETIHGIFGLGELTPWMQYLLTIIVIAGVVNAFNLMDGVDGLAAGLAIIGFAIYAVISTFTGQYQLTLTFLTFIGALIGFLRFNFSKKRKIFMGDAGSLVIGFVLVVGGIQLMQGAVGNARELLLVLGVVGVLLVPVMDAIRVFYLRMLAGKSPFKADRNHLHHLVLALGVKHKLAAIIIIGLSLLLIVFGVLTYHIVGLTFALVVMLLVFYTVTSFLQFNKKIKTWKKRIKQMEIGEL